MSHILPKKEWHVYNETNKEKVKHDEERVKLKEELLQSKAEKSTRESRLNMLRMRAGLPSSSTTTTDDGSKGTNKTLTKHVDLFEDLRDTPDRLTQTQKELKERKNREAPYTKHMLGEEAPPRYHMSNTGMTDHQQERLKREDPMAKFISKREERKIVDQLNNEDFERTKQGKKYHSQFVARTSQMRRDRSKSPDIETQANIRILVKVFKYECYWYSLFIMSVNQQQALNAALYLKSALLFLKVDLFQEVLIHELML